MSLERHADARQQLLDGEGLGHIIVRAHVQPHNLVGHVILGGEHDDGHVVVLADAAAHLDAAQLGQHQIQQYQIAPPGLVLLDGAAPVVRYADVVALVHQFQLKIARQLLLVLNNQYLLHFSRRLRARTSPYSIVMV